MAHDDSLFSNIIRQYEDTADRLYKGETVGAEEMRRFHGMTGILVGRISQSLWSKEELKEEIDARLEVKCKDCKTAAVLSEGAGFRIGRMIVACRWPIAVALFSPWAPAALDAIGKWFGH